MIRRILTAAALAAAAAAWAAEPGARFVELFNAATAAHAARDYAQMEQRLEEALTLRPNHPTALYNIAAAQALRGKTAAALANLQTLASMGLSFEPARDGDFELLARNARFAEINAAFERNRDPVGGASLLFRMFEPTFVPEGLAYDRDTSAWLIGGAHERAIWRLRRGEMEPVPFIGPGSGLWAPMGMDADPSRRLLWVATAAIPQMRDADEDELGRSAILAYDLDSGQRKRRYALEARGRTLLGDLELHRGTLYTTDSAGGILYALDTASGKFRALTRPGELASPQGLALSRDRSLLYVADYTQGLFAWDLVEQRLLRLDIAPNISIYGIDGLYAYKNHLIAVQNGVRPHRVVRLTLDDSGRRVRRAYVLAANLPEIDDPSLGAIVGNRFSFIANSQWNRFDKNHRLPPREQLRSPVVLRVALD